MRHMLFVLVLVGCTAPNPDYRPAGRDVPPPAWPDMALQFDEVDFGQLEDGGAPAGDISQLGAEDLGRPTDMGRPADLMCPWLYASQCTYQDAGGPPVFCVMALGRRLAPNEDCELPPPQLFIYCNAACDLCPDGGIAVTNRYKGNRDLCEAPK